MRVSLEFFCGTGAKTRARSGMRNFRSWPGARGANHLGVGGGGGGSGGAGGPRGVLTRDAVFLSSSLKILRAEATFP